MLGLQTLHPGIGDYKSTKCELPATENITAGLKFTDDQLIVIVSELNDDTGLLQR